MSLAQLWAALRAARWSIAAMMLVATAIAAWQVLQIPKQYTAKARVMLGINNTDPTQYSALKSRTEDAYIGTQMRLVNDDAVTRAVVRKLGWADDTQVVAAWQGATGGVGDITAWLAQQIGQATYPRQLEDSSIIEIYYSSSSLAAAKEIASQLRSAFIEQSLQLRVDGAKRAAAWNKTQATKALATLHTAEAARTAFVTTNKIAVDRPTGGLDYAAQATTMAAATAEPDKRATVAAMAVEPAALAILRRRLDTLDAELAVLSLRGEANPATTSMTAQRDETARQLARERAVAQAGTNTTPDQIGLVRHQRDADYLAARLNLLERAPLYDRLAAIDRDIALKSERYNAAAARIAGFEAIAAAPSGMKIIGDVIGDPEPSFPNVPATLIIAAGASGALAAAIAIVGVLVRRQVGGVEDLQFFAGVPVLAVISNERKRRARGAPWFRWLAGKRIRPVHAT